MARDLKKQMESKRKANVSPESEKPQPRLCPRGSLPDQHEMTEFLIQNSRSRTYLERASCIQR